MIFRQTICALLCATGLWAQTPSPTPSPTPQRFFKVSGIVYNAHSGDPLAHAQIGISPVENRDALVSTESGNDGSFVFTNVTPGKYLLVGEKRGFRQQLFEEHEGLSTAIAVGVGLNAEKLIFRMEPDASIYGRIADEQGDPVETAQVLLVHDEVVNGVRGRHVQQGVLSDDEGNFHFSHLAPGSYFVVVYAWPWYALQSAATTPPEHVNKSSNWAQQRSLLEVTYPRTFYVETTDPAKATPIVVKAGDRIETDMMLLALPTVSIRVKLPLHRYPATEQIGVSQTLMSGIERQVPAHVKRLDHDFMEVSGLAPGRYTLQIHTSNGKTARQVDKIVDALTDIQIDGEAGNIKPSISGTLKFANPQPGLPDISQMYIQLRKHGSDEIFTAKAGDSGEFNMEPGTSIVGRYELVVGTGGDSLPVTVTAESAQVKGQTIEIAQDSPVKLSLVLSSTIGKIEGVALRKDKPVSGAMVVLVPKDPENNIALFRRGQTNTDGTFTLSDVSTGWYSIVAIENGWDLDWTKASTIKPYLAGGTDVSVWYNPKPKVMLQVQDRKLASTQATSTSTANTPAQQ